MDDVMDIAELLAMLFPQGGSLPVFAAGEAPSSQSPPYGVYHVIGNQVAEALEGETTGAGFVVQIDVWARSYLDALSNVLILKRALAGEHVAPSGLSVRVDFDSERSLGSQKTPDGDEEISGHSCDFTFYPGL